SLIDLNPATVISAMLVASVLFVSLVTTLAAPARLVALAMFPVLMPHKAAPAVDARLGSVYPIRRTSSRSPLRCRARRAAGPPARRGDDGSTSCPGSRHPRVGRPHCS